MNFFIFILLACLFIFLYCVYVLANDDFIFLRRDVTMEKIFNIIFIGSLASLLVARIFYGISVKSIFVSPFTFLLIPYFPGLSLLGGVVGIGIYLFFIVKRRENSFPLERMCDFFSIAFLISLPVGFLGYLLFSEGSAEMIKLGAQAFVYLGLFIIFLKFFLPKLLSGKFKEGTITLFFLIFFSLVNLIANAFLEINALEYLKNFENIILILIFLLSIGKLIWYEGPSIVQFKKGK
jgi:prolipoprotein diacylglyceryltransferase